MQTFKVFSDILIITLQKDNEVLHAWWLYEWLKYYALSDISPL